MILAELHGKLSSKVKDMEDILTSNVFSFFKYSKRSFLRDYLGSLGVKVTVQEADLAEFYFWPVYDNGTEPDLVIIVGQYYVLIEAKLFSGFASETKDTKSQVQREIDSGMIEAKNLNKDFIYMTITNEYVTNNHKLNKYKDSSLEIISTNWQALSKFLFGIIKKKDKSDQKYLNDLYALLMKKKLRSYISINNLKSSLKSFNGKFIFFDWESSQKEEFTGFSKGLKNLAPINLPRRNIFYK